MSELQITLPRRSTAWREGVTDLTGQGRQFAAANSNGAVTEGIRLRGIATARHVGDCRGLMGNSQGRDNAKKRRARRKKTERLALAKKNKKAPGK